MARGGFEITEMRWEDGKVSRLVVKSKNGGLCRLRSATPLNGKGVKVARGENKNALYDVPAIATPLINKEAKLNNVNLEETYLYDLQTKAGQEYVLIATTK